MSNDGLLLASKTFDCVGRVSTIRAAYDRFHISAIYIIVLCRKLIPPATGEPSVSGGTESTVKWDSTDEGLFKYYQRPVSVSDDEMWRELHYLTRVGAKADELGCKNISRVKGIVTVKEHVGPINRQSMSNIIGIFFECLPHNLHHVRDKVLFGQLVTAGTGEGSATATYNPLQMMMDVTNAVACMHSVRDSVTSAFGNLTPTVICCDRENGIGRWGVECLSRAFKAAGDGSMQTSTRDIAGSTDNTNSSPVHSRVWSDQSIDFPLGICHFLAPETVAANRLAKIARMDSNGRFHVLPVDSVIVCSKGATSLKDEKNVDQKSNTQNPPPLEPVIVTPTRTLVHHPVTTGADVYSVAALLFWIVVGSLPYGSLLPADLYIISEWNLKKWKEQALVQLETRDPPTCSTGKAESQPSFKSPVSVNNKCDTPSTGFAGSRLTGSGEHSFTQIRSIPSDMQITHRLVLVTQSHRRVEKFRSVRVVSVTLYAFGTICSDIVKRPRISHPVGSDRTRIGV